MAPKPQIIARSKLSVVFSGGMGLGAYQAGVYEALDKHGYFDVVHLAGSSVGAINAALIAGNAREHRIEKLRRFWMETPAPQQFAFQNGPIRHAQNWLSVLRGRLFGAPGHFRPRWNWDTYPVGSFSSFYSLRPMRAQLEQLVDFERLNESLLRVSVATTDIETGQLVIFDNRTNRIGVEHLLASCGYFPEFAPVQISNRLLGDGGFSANAPIEAVLDATDGPRIILVVDLFSREGKRPTSLEAALERKNDLLFANQTYQRLEAFRREEVWRRKLGESSRRILYLSYRAAGDEAGPEKTFDYSHQTLHQRWQSGFLDYQEVCRLNQHRGDGFIAQVSR